MTPTPMLGIGTWVRILPTPWSIDCGHAGKLGVVFQVGTVPGLSDEPYYWVELQNTTDYIHVTPRHTHGG